MMGRMRYATPADWSSADVWGGNAADAPTQGELDRAGDRVAEMVRGAVYDPKDAATRNALARATCAQAAFISDMGDPTGAVSAMGGASIGSVRLPGGSAEVAARAGGGRYAEEAVSILRVAGLLDVFPRY